MKDETAIKIIRTLCGTMLLVTHAFTDINSMLVSVALVLIGVPFELVKKKD